MTIKLKINYSNPIKYDINLTNAQITSLYFKNLAKYNKKNEVTIDNPLICEINKNTMNIFINFLNKGIFEFKQQENIKNDSHTCKYLYFLADYFSCYGLKESIRSFVKNLTSYKLIELCVDDYDLNELYNYYFFDLTQKLHVAYGSHYIKSCRFYEFLIENCKDDDLIIHVLNNSINYTEKFITTTFSYETQIYKKNMESAFTLSCKGCGKRVIERFYNKNSLWANKDFDLQKSLEGNNKINSDDIKEILAKIQLNKSY